MLDFVHDLIAKTAQKQPNALALTFKKQTFTYNELLCYTKKIAIGYQSLNLVSGDRVGIYLAKNIPNIGCMFACSLTDNCFVPINPVLKARQVEHIINDCQIKVLITNQTRLQTLLPKLKQLTSLTHIILTDQESTIDLASKKITLLSWDGFIANKKTVNFTITSPLKNQVAAILYTSGSTGQPKGVMLSHTNITLGAKAVVSYLNNTPKDNILAVLPLSFDYGLNQVTSSFLAGATCVLLDYLRPIDIIRAIDKYKITGLAAVPPLWSQLAKLPWSSANNSSLRYFTNSGGILTQATLQQLRTLLPQAKPYLMYGLTEAFRSTYLAPEDLDLKPGSIGKAIPYCEVLVVNKAGKVCEADEPGELVHTGPLVSLGYWNAKEQTAKRFKLAPNQNNSQASSELAVWSGDTVKKDSDGFLYFIARNDDMIKTSGYRLSPSEVEEILYQHTAVIEAAVIGINHALLGQAILAIITSNTKVCLTKLSKELLLTCQKNLANYMIPKEIILLPQLPHNVNGKIDRKQLQLSYQHFFTE